MSDRTPAPVLATPRPDRRARVSRVLWALSFVAGVLLLGIAFLRRSRQFELLRGFISEAEPGYDPSTVDTAATAAFWGALAVLAAFTLAELMLRRAAEHRAAVRWLLLLVLAAHGTVALVGEEFVALAEGAAPYRWVLAAQLLLGAAALAVVALGRRRPRRDQDGTAA